MKRKHFENNPLRSLLKDKKVMEQVADQAENLKERLTETHEIGAM